MYRSTKGASKARRDQINAEIRQLKDLLPISEADKARLSYLHIMSLASMYTRKSVFFTQAGTAASLEECARFLSFPELSELTQALPGFLMLVTGEGKLLYLSDSVSEHLGHSMVDLVAQGDSVYDIIDASDHFIMRSNLSVSTSLETDRLFRCRFNTSKSVRRQSAGNKLVLIRARCLSPPSGVPAAGTYWTANTVWVCFCSPLEPHPSRSGPGADPESTSTPPPADTNLFLPCFRSEHSRDMRLQTAQQSVSAFLGFDVTDLRSCSWYSLIHPQDLSHASAQHRSLLREGGEGRAEMVVRVQAQDQSWVWIYMVLQLQPGEIPISSNNYVISESEAWSVRQQLTSEATQLTLVLSSGTSQQEGLSLQSPETLSSPDQVFTPGSSGLSAQSFDFSTAGCSVGSSDERGSSAAEAMQVEGDPRSITVETVADLDFLTQNILLPPSFQLDPALPALPLPLPPVSTSQAQQQTKEFVCTPPYTPHVVGSNFPFGEPLFSFEPAGTTTPPPSTTTATSTTSMAPAASSSDPPTTAKSPSPPTSLSTKLPLTLSTTSTDFLFPIEHGSGSLYEKLPPTPDSPGDDGDCTVMTLPEVRGPLYVDVPFGPLQCPPEGLLTPEASPGKYPYLSFFSLEREREKERAEISLLAQHISSLAEGFYLDPLLSKLSPPSMSPSSAPPSPFLSPTLETADDVDSGHMLREFYPIKAWRGLDVPMFLDDDESLFEESILEALLQDTFCAGANPPSLRERATSVASNRRNVTPRPASPPLILTASPRPAFSTPIASPGPAVSCNQSLLEELAVLEPMFGAGASIAPGLGQQPELYQLQCHPSPQCFHKDGSGSVPPF
ncbi:Neuronal PAS domain containing protein 4A [Dissostichus eleginoides]|uniref:Neuronal PAS domain containing protein 4A n=1 Tax=Dissostichus eleginoides TaxID=100907 RepID=A0AAD9CR48_DISEL|nr:Neuronal PAS domain containing protein 4A [Dissostichus eleginoides]